VIGPLPEVTFYGLATAYFVLCTITHRGVILLMSFGQSRISDTGERVLRWLSGFFALASFASFLWALLT
jgi:hypothetical protein